MTTFAVAAVDATVADLRQTADDGAVAGAAAAVRAVTWTPQRTATPSVLN